jgi:hypothetical protein
VHLEPELGHRPDCMVALHLGHGDPRRRALSRIIQHGPFTFGILSGEPGDLLVHRGQGAHFAVHRLCFPSGEPLRGGGFGGTGLPGDGAARLGLGAPRVLSGLLVQQPQRPAVYRARNGHASTRHRSVTTI